MNRRISVEIACTSLVAIAAAVVANPAFAADKGKSLTAWEASRTNTENELVTTGVARGRDRLDSATSTSSIKENEVTKLAPRSLAELFRNIPGIRAEAGTGEANNNYTVRGLPLVGTGSKYIQFQEDGLPVMEFGNMSNIGADNYIRADLNVASVDSIRGGSSSTFASNAPGGVINLLSKTGEVEGGSVQATAGLDYESYRMDFDYGGKLSDTWRFHVGGFYREGEGPRETGYTAYRGGQVKFNITKTFDGGYIRFLGKVLDDRTPFFFNNPVGVSGTNDKPTYYSLPNFSATSGSFLSPYVTTHIALDPDGVVRSNNLNEGYHVQSKSGGVEVQFTLADWTVTERFRYSDMSGRNNATYPFTTLPAQTLAAAFSGDPAATLSYASGPLKGSAINPATVNGNGLLALTVQYHQNLRDAGNLTNDLRFSRVWNVAAGDLTTTFGVYKARQNYKADENFVTLIQDVIGNGSSALVDIRTSTGVPVTQNGAFAYGIPGLAGNVQLFDVTYDVLAPYGSFNYHQGRISVGGSVRYDFDRVNGQIARDTTVRSIDLDGNGILTPPERTFAAIPLGVRNPVNYSNGYISYSAGINFRASENFALFGRYSRGSRAGADQILFSPAVSLIDGSLRDKKAAQDVVRQTEAGVKFRTPGLALSLTGFYVLTSETNTQISVDVNGNGGIELVSRSYKTYGAEFEGSVRRGIFSVNAGATLTGGEITGAQGHPELIGHTPRHQAALIYSLTPQIETNRMTVGANIIGQTGSYTQDINLLKMPGFTTVGLFAQYSPVDRLVLSVNASNVFNTKAFVDIGNSTIPANGIATGLTLYGRMISTSARFFF